MTMKAAGLLIAVLLPLASATAGETALKRVSFIPQWAPQAQFAGYYVAFEKGFYLDAGLQVDILRGGPERPPLDLLTKGPVQFGSLFLATGIQAHAQGVPLINLAQIIQRSTQMLVARKAGGISTPADLNGRKVGLWGPEYQLLPRAFFRKYNLSVSTIPQSMTLNLFLRGGVDVASAMSYNEYHTIISSGVEPEELTTFFFFDYGMNFPEDGIYCRLETYQEDPRTCCGFVQASLKGWRYAHAHPEEALDIVMNYVERANLATDRCHQKWMLEHILTAMEPVASSAGGGQNAARDRATTDELQDFSFGVLRQKGYETVARELQQVGLIEEIPDFSQFYVNCVP